MTHGRGFGNDHGEHNGAPLSHDTTDTPDRTDTVDVTASPQDVYAAESTATKVLRVSRSHVSGAAAGLLAVTAVTSGVLTVGATDVAPPTSMPTVAATSPAEQSAAPSDVSTTAAGVAGLPGMDPLAAAQLVSAAMSATGANTGEPASVVRAAPVSGVIPQRMVEAYQRGEAVAAQRAPQCNMPWWLLAGIGRVESGHAAGGAVDANGVTVTRILGPRLDGTTPDTAVITDTDGGRFDGDPHYDRAVGPMQFIPGTWVLAGVDGNGDGTANPSQVDDAAASAAMYLCSGGGDMSNPADMASAILRYNNSTQYVQDVLAGATAYRDGHVPVTPPRKIQAAPETSQTTTQAAKGAPAPSSAARQATPVGPAGRPAAPTADGQANAEAQARAAAESAAAAGSAASSRTASRGSVPAEGESTARPAPATATGSTTSPSTAASGSATTTSGTPTAPTAASGTATASTPATPETSAPSKAARSTAAPSTAAPTTAAPSATAPPSSAPPTPTATPSGEVELPTCRPSDEQLAGLPKGSPLHDIDWDSEPLADLTVCTAPQLTELEETYTKAVVQQLIDTGAVAPAPKPTN